ncbi:hypothetical protein [Oceanobacillus profundus]|uniref:Uncharacterized protein n=1 Tax=Oceanobacillus profundus TaxID=372463 RepID=A0A417YEI4_9BACI|nr:hypothetical protein [Oceanobacillus profundus]MBR3118164.1 hypothetical protein [Oceanobacillus sp.]MCM3398953.1 hypothetical protein [Oceanobacillus profundus]PAE28460.1 hypothetical protein CHI07_14205 [Paenibacillus sp. 7884-2]RHW31073.1 hypothetical protein D1B32_14990 [Oceanobacillus profundus]
MSSENKHSSTNERPKWNEERRTKLDEQKEQKFVDDIPMEDLKIESQDEKKKTKTKDDSQSERKYQRKNNSEEQK